jgi:hypothetical protein
MFRVQSIIAKHVLTGIKARRSMSAVTVLTAGSDGDRGRRTAATATRNITQHGQRATYGIWGASYARRTH